MKKREIQRLKDGDLSAYRELMELFAREFEENETYLGAIPSDLYVSKLLKDSNMVFLIERSDFEIVGGLVAYILRKFEQERSELYIYDLAVDRGNRREGVATRLINALKPIAKAADAWVIFVQADHGDEPATKLYESLGEREEVLHFDIGLS